MFERGYKRLRVCVSSRCFLAGLVCQVTELLQDRSSGQVRPWTDFWQPPAAALCRKDVIYFTSLATTVPHVPPHA
eukprot:4258043-Amphidinium_carterae.2